jgi:hypothetical protein
LITLDCDEILTNGGLLGDQVGDCERVHSGINGVDGAGDVAEGAGDDFFGGEVVAIRRCAVPRARSWSPGLI